MNKYYHQKPIIKEIEDQKKSLIRRMPLNKITIFGIIKTELTTQILAKIVTAFVITITKMEKTSKKLMSTHLLMPRSLKPMIIGILERATSEKMNKLLNSSTTQKVGNSIVILEVDNITL